VSLECGGKRSATPLWISLEFCHQAVTPFRTHKNRLKAELQTKALSPLRSAGALQIFVFTIYIGTI